MPIFQLGRLIDALLEMGYGCHAGSQCDIRPERQAYFERWLKNRDGFVAMEHGSNNNNNNIDFIGIEEVVRMGPFFNVYFLIENDSLADGDSNAHNLVDASPYYRLQNGRATDLGWSGGVLSTLLAKDAELSAELAKNIMKEEVKRINVKARDYCCIIETGVWDPAGLASVFGMVDRIGAHVRKLLKQVHFGEEMNV
ncbi:MAG: hypothetical protein ABI347_04520 [Nitrososphaera sp.]|jgi:hypothetical protein